MAKSEVPVLMSKTNDLGYTWSVIEPTDLWIITYRFKPISLKKNSETDPACKYERIAFTQNGSEINLAKKLNQMFDSIDFDIRAV